MLMECLSCAMHFGGGGGGWGSRCGWVGGGGGDRLDFWTVVRNMIQPGMIHSRVLCVWEMASRLSCVCGQEIFLVWGVLCSAFFSFFFSLYCFPFYFSNRI